MASMSCKSNIAMAAFKKYKCASITISRLCIIRHSGTNNHSQLSKGPHNFNSPGILNIHPALQTQRSFYTSATFYANTIVECHNLSFKVLLVKSWEKEASR